jgi:hypothetical protein
VGDPNQEPGIGRSIAGKGALTAAVATRLRFTSSAEIRRDDPSGLHPRDGLASDLISVATEI